MTVLLDRLLNFGNSMPGVVSLGLIWGIMAIGLYITYKILNLSDLTVDGSFATGCAVCVMLIAMGCPAWFAMLCAFIAGMAAGSVTGFLHTVCKIPAILAGILTQLGLWTVNMFIMGLGNLQTLRKVSKWFWSLFEKPFSALPQLWQTAMDKLADGTLFPLIFDYAKEILVEFTDVKLISTLIIPARDSDLLVSSMYLSKSLDGFKALLKLIPTFGQVENEQFFTELGENAAISLLYPPLVMLVVTVILVAILYWFFGTERGASIRATGANEHMARAQGINTNVNKMLGLMLANGLVALSGALFAQYNGSAEINMGRGAIVIGLAAIIIGEVLFGKLFKNFALKLAAVSVGAIIYYIVIQAVLTLLKVDSQYLKLMSAAIVAIFLTVPNLRAGHPKKHKKTEVSTCSR